jgi:FAD/FMN-containing dehydrogenase
MSGLNLRQLHRVSQIVGARARFDAPARQVYSSDLGGTPRRRWPFGQPALADGIVWPDSEKQVQKLALFARDEGIPLVPRGSGTAAAGGAIPVRGGLVVDMTGIAGVTETDGLQVTVRGGSQWSQVATDLHSHGLALRMYPTSAPLSTVGGWLAQGGAGLGSFAFGWIDQNVAYVRLVDGRGELHWLSGDELNTVTQAQGTTGFISEVTLHIRPGSATSQHLVSLPDALSLAEMIKLVTEQELPVWSLTFLNPTGAERINTMRYWRNAVNPVRTGLPSDRYVAVVACEASDDALVHRRLTDIGAVTDGHLLSDALARREWEARFRPLRAAYSSDAIAPADVIVPTPRLAAVLSQLERQYEGSVAVEGVCVRGGETVVHAYVHPGAPGAREAGGLHLALEVMDLAERYGGRGYAVGHHFGARAKTILGQTRSDWIQDARELYDTAGILNPGKLRFNRSPSNWITSRFGHN